MFCSKGYLRVLLRKPSSIRFLSSLVSRPSGVNVVEDGKKLDLVWKRDEKWTFNSIWLRHNCQCKECLSPEGQKTPFLEQSFRNAISASLKIESAQIEGEKISVNWDAGKWSHTGHFPIQWLSENKYLEKRKRELPTTRTLPKISFLDISESDEGALRLLTNIQQYGMSLVNNVPTSEEGMRKVAEKIGPIHGISIYGEIFQVICKENPFDITQTKSSLPLHTDHTYRQYPHGILMIHCIRNDECVIGGETILLDAFPIVEELRTNYPHHFKILTNISACFKIKTHYDNDKCAEAGSWGPHLEVDDLGQLIRIRWHPLFESAHNIPEDQMEEYYEAYALLYDMIENSKNKIVHQLLPGDLYIVDNYRILHARTNFQLNGGVRHMMGLYQSADDFALNLAILTKKLK